MSPLPMDVPIVGHAHITKAEKGEDYMSPPPMASRVAGDAARPSAAGTDRTGPLGRLARLILAAAMGLSLASIVDQGGVVGFRRPSVLTEPSVWFLDASMLALFAHLVGRLAAALAGARAAPRWQLGALVGLAAALAVAALVGRAVFGAVWGFPLADLVWAFDVAMLVETVVALLLAIALGTPGCEIGVWPELIARARRASRILGRTGLPRRPPLPRCVGGAPPVATRAGRAVVSGGSRGVVASDTPRHRRSACTSNASTRW